MSNSFEALMYSAGLCEQIEDYDAMIDVMKRVMKIVNTSQVDSPVKVRNLFSVAYKNIAGSSRTAWRVLCTEMSKHESDPVKCEILKNFMQKTETKLTRTCDDVIKTIDELVINLPIFSDAESKVFFLKMKADYLRYKAEVCDEEKDIFKQVSEDSNKCYMDARELAADLKCTNPVRLGLALNYSVFLYEIAKSCKQACEVAKASFDESIGGLDDLNEDHYKDSTLIMQLLRDNMTLWTNQEEQFEKEDAQKNEVKEEEEREQKHEERNL